MRPQNYLLLMILFTVAITAQAQRSQESDQERMLREQRAIDANNTRARLDGFSRIQRVSAANQGYIRVVRKGEGISFRFDPNLTKADIKAISIHPEDLSRYLNFLKQPKTGIVRLHNGKTCSPEKLIVQADSPCPNNITGKATAYSFRTEDYRVNFISDIFFSDNKFTAPGLFTIGIFSELGDVELNDLTLLSEGIKQLAEHQPSDNEAEIEKQYGIFSRGIKIGDYVYKSQAAVKENTSYVLRSTAYKGRIFRGSGSERINLVGDDERKDVLVVFRVVRTHEDGSVTLLWKELDRKPVPKILLEEKNNSKNKEK